MANARNFTFVSFFRWNRTLSTHLIPNFRASLSTYETKLLLRKFTSHVTTTNLKQQQQRVVSCWTRMFRFLKHSSALLMGWQQLVEIQPERMRFNYNGYTQLCFFDFNLLEKRIVLWKPSSGGNKHETKGGSSDYRCCSNSCRESTTGIYPWNRTRLLYVLKHICSVWS